MGADVGVLVRSLVVAVQVERAVVLVLVVVTADVQNDARRIVVATVVTELKHPLVVWKSQLKDVCGKRGLRPLVFTHPFQPPTAARLR